ncbi:zinc-binding dehydrogenase [Umezawaea sp. Da 62-37]|uniref:zinc-binding dehydrogenase n=1 Tax=Umezawaea sp. Da 62-37 TaxID=3075927 RepID=UPI0028F70C76|nr:zinc-binding dehydrogenase [Umezawaea sp. Da 62-37]WNV90419.1 zinc-binding dehydrogenase [Umezawaea sp. Da 62-37]
MRAVWLREFGGPEVLVEEATPDPAPGPGQVVIAVALVNTTFVETQVRAGRAPWPVRLPIIPGNGVGGIVTESADPALVGATVVTGTGGSGAYAERVAVNADELIAVPPDIPLDHAVALLADGRTATMLADAVGLRAGDRVLVEAAAGGVGTLLVQLARAAGAVVVAAVGGSHKVAAVTGADVVVDYRSDDWADQVRTAVGALDVVFDGVGGTIARTAFSLVAAGGRMISYGASCGERAGIQASDAADHGVALLGLPRPTTAEARACTLRAFGSLVPVIGQRFPLARASDAHAAIESRSTIGKTLLEV